MKKMLFFLFTIFFCIGKDSYTQQHDFQLSVVSVGMNNGRQNGYLDAIRTIVRNKTLTTYDDVRFILNLLRTEYDLDPSRGDTLIWNSLEIEYLNLETLEPNLRAQATKILIIISDGGLKFYSLPFISDDLNNLTDKKDAADMITRKLKEAFTIYPVCVRGSEENRTIMRSLSTSEDNNGNGKVWQLNDITRQIQDEVLDALYQGPVVCTLILDHSGSIYNSRRQITETVGGFIKNISEGNSSVKIVLDRCTTVTGGRIMIGSRPNDTGHRPDETLHEVDLSRFIISPYLTQEQCSGFLWDELGTRNNPSAIKGADLPQTNFSYELIVNRLLPYINNNWTGIPGRWRLPTEAELEFVLRRHPRHFENDLRLRIFSNSFYGEYNVQDRVNPQGRTSGVFVVTKGYSFDDDNSILQRAAFRGRIEPNAESKLTGIMFVFEAF